MGNSFFGLLGVVEILTKVGCSIDPKYGPIADDVKLYVIEGMEGQPAGWAQLGSSLSQSLLLVNSTFRLKVAFSDNHASVSSGGSSLNSVYKGEEMLLQVKPYKARSSTRFYAIWAWTLELDQVSKSHDLNRSVMVFESLKPFERSKSSHRFTCRVISKSAELIHLPYRLSTLCGPLFNRTKGIPWRGRRKSTKPSPLN
jgi:hypothetical protein